MIQRTKQKVGRWVIGLVLITPWLMTATSVSGRNQTPDQDRELHQTYDLAERGVISVNNLSGYIRINSWNQNKVKVDAVKRTRDGGEIDQVRIQVNATGNRLEIRTIYPRSRSNVSVDIDILAPASVVLNSITSTSGDVTLNGPFSSAIARSTSGAVVARDIREMATLSSTSGNVTVTNIGGELRATSTSGNVSVNDAKSRLFSQSTSGNVTVVQVKEDATASSSSGNVRLEKIGGRASGRSLSGSVFLTDIGGDGQGDSLSDNVSLINIGGRAVAKSVSGNAVVRVAAEGATATSVSGAVEVVDVKGRVEAGTTSGTIRLVNLDSRDVIAKSTSGDVRYTGKCYEDGRYELESFSSNVILFFPPDSQFRLTARSRSGSISTDFPLQVNGLTGERGVATGVVGKGGAEVRLSSFSGNIQIKKGAPVGR
jgi:DUF4097 and DUF4098 domain-containing protein YvlB